MLFKKRLFIVLSFIALNSFAQTAINNENEDHDHHEEHRNHIGLAVGPVYVLHEEEYAPGLHFHYMYLFQVANTEFGIGLGLESILDEHRHYATSINLSYLPIHNLTLTVSPGIQFGPDVEEFTSHFEASYEFNFGEIHLGPVLEYAYAKDDEHAMLGLHVGFGF